MNAVEFRSALARHELTQGGLARLLVALGDQTEVLSVRRRVERWAQGGASPPGEITALFTLLDRYPQIMVDLRPATMTETDAALARGESPYMARTEAARAARRGAATARAMAAPKVTAKPRKAPKARPKAGAKRAKR